MIPNALFLATLLLYALSAGLYHVPALVRGARGGRWGQGAALLGLVTHSIAIIERSVVLGHAPYVQLREAVATIAWVIVLLTLLVEWRRRTTALGALAMPLAALMMVMADTLPLFGSANPLVPLLYEKPVDAHIGAIVSAFGGFALAFCAALLYLAQERRLKEKRAGAQTPGALSLADIEQVANSLAAFGFSMLSLGLAIGAMYAAGGLWTGAWMAEPIVLASLGTWCVYAWYLYNRGVRGSRGRINMYFLVAGFSLAFVTVLVIRVLAPGQHGFHVHNESLGKPSILMGAGDRKP